VSPGSTVWKRISVWGIGDQPTASGR
jgi:hypothetical protein